MIQRAPRATLKTRTLARAERQGELVSSTPDRRARTYLLGVRLRFLS